MNRDASKMPELEPTLTDFPDTSPPIRLIIILFLIQLSVQTRTMMLMRQYSTNCVVFNQLSMAMECRSENEKILLEEQVRLLMQYFNIPLRIPHWNDALAYHREYEIPQKNP